MTNYEYLKSIINDKDKVYKFIVDILNDSLEQKYESEENSKLEELKQKQIKLIGFDPEDKEEYLEAVKCSGDALRYVKEQTPDICLEAVRQNGYALQYVKEQTTEICLEAVKHDGDALVYVKEQTPEICLEAVKCNGYALQYVKDLSMIIDN